MLMPVHKYYLVKKKKNKRLAVGSIWLKAVASALKVSSTPSISTSSF